MIQCEQCGNVEYFVGKLAEKEQNTIQHFNLPLTELSEHVAHKIAAAHTEVMEQMQLLKKESHKIIDFSRPISN